MATQSPVYEHLLKPIHEIASLQDASQSSGKAAKCPRNGVKTYDLLKLPLEICPKNAMIVYD